MIPAAIQMGAMTLSMMGIKTAADMAAFSIMGMNAAPKLYACSNRCGCGISWNRYCDCQPSRGKC